MSTTLKAKPRLVWVSVRELRPAPENELIYRPVSLNDPDIQNLAASINEHGVLSPLVVTQDGYILSGHRRFAACRLAGVAKVPCEVKPITRQHPEFETLLCEYNRQRVKSFDEIVREQVVFVDPEEAYESLIEHRRAASEVNGDFLKIEGTKVRHDISDAKQPMLKAIMEIVYRYRSFWPLSDRSIHYYLLNKPPLRHASKPGSRYRNDRSSYQDATDIITRGRLTGEIPFEAIADPTRTVCKWKCYRDVGGFVDESLDSMFKGYWRDLMQSQPNHIEIVGEKNTVEGSIRPVAAKFCIPYTLGRGYCSLDPRHQMYQRFKKSGKQKLIILILSDFDPEGEDIPNSFARSMRDDFDVIDVVAKKVCLTHEQVLARDLPKTFDLKTDGSRYAKFKAKYGDRAHELEALQPEERSQLLTEAIDQVIDIRAFNRELDAEKRDAEKLARLRATVGPALRTALDTMGKGVDS
jgi:hypothetical protein